MSQLGDRLRQLRQGISQAQIARELGMKQPQYARYESGASSPSADVIIKMCEIFCCSADDILGTHRGSTSSLTVNGSGNAIGPGANAVTITGAVAQVPGESAGCKRCPYKAAVKKLQKAGLKIPGLDG